MSSFMLRYFKQYDDVNKQIYESDWLMFYNRSILITIDNLLIQKEAHGFKMNGNIQRENYKARLLAGGRISFRVSENRMRTF